MSFKSVSDGTTTSNLVVALILVQVANLTFAQLFNFLLLVCSSARMTAASELQEKLAAGAEVQAARPKDAIAAYRDIALGSYPNDAECIKVRAGSCDAERLAGCVHGPRVECPICVDGG